MSDAPPLRCAALYRVSTARQVRTADDGETLPMQRTAIREFLAQYHPTWTLVAEWAEEGVSAYRQGSERRDVLQAVLRAAAHRAFDVLLLFKADRLSRQAFEYPLLLGQLHRAGIQVISVADAPGGKVLETTGQTEKLLRFIEGWQAETESYNTSLRVRAAMRQLVQQGRWPGGPPPYGFAAARDADGHATLAIAPAEAAVVRQVFQWYLTGGLGTRAIADRLNAMGSRTRFGKPWTFSAIRRLLMNPIVAGQVAYGKTRRSGSGASSVWRPAATWADEAVFGPPHPEWQIVTPAEWRAAQERLHAYNRGSGSVYNRGGSTSYLLSGLARCGTCGGPIYGGYGPRLRSPEPGRPPYREQYFCLARRNSGRSACAGQATYSRRKVETAVLAAVRATLLTVDEAALIAHARRVAEEALFQTRLRAQDLRRRAEEAERLRAAWLARLERHLVDPAASLYREATLAEELRKAEARCEALRAELDALATEEAAAAQQVDAFCDFLRTSQHWWALFLRAPRPEQKALLRRLVERVVLSADGFVIHYRLDFTAAGPPLTWRAAHPWSKAANA